MSQSQDTPTKYFTANETENYGNELVALKQYFREEPSDLNNRLEVLNKLGDVSSSHDATAIFKPEIQFLREKSKNKKKLIQSLLKNESLLLRKKDKRNGSLSKISQLKKAL